MSRAFFQVLVLPYRITTDNRILYAVFKRQASTGGYWQGIAGGGEDDESPLEAAKREAFEEARIPNGSRFIQLESTASIPASAISGLEPNDDLQIIPEYSFGVRVEESSLYLSDEHTESKWLDYAGASELLRWDGNRKALSELDNRIRMNLPEFN